MTKQGLEYRNQESADNFKGLEPVIILAAGRSGRMGNDKAKLKYNDHSDFIGHLLNSYFDAGVSKMILVVNEKFLAQDNNFPSTVSVVVNRHPEKGRLSSMLCGMQLLEFGQSCFLQNVDNPYIETGLLQALSQVSTPESYVVPMHNGRGGHPILLGSEMIRYILTSGYIRDFRTVLSRFARMEVEWADEKVLLNINTPDDYLKFRKMIDLEHKI